MSVLVREVDRRARYAKSKRPLEALALFEKMIHKGITPNEYTFTCILIAIAETTNLAFGKQIHTQIEVEEG